jgi:iron(III) transport system permease protein
VALVLALWLRARAGGRAAVPLPQRSLGPWRYPALAVPLFYLVAGIVLPVVVMARWAMGSTLVGAPLSFATLRGSLQNALTQAGGDLVHTVLVAAAAAVLTLLVGLPLARFAARRQGWVEHVSVLPLAVPAILLGIGFVHAYNGPHVAGLYATIFDFYDSTAILVTAYAARFLPFAVLTLAGAVRRVPRALDEAALLSGRGPLARALHIHGPLLAPAAASAASLLFVLGLRELDTAVMLPAGNETVVRRLANVVHFGGEDVGGALALLLLLVAVLVPALVMLVSGRRLQSLS